MMVPSPERNTDRPLKPYQAMGLPLLRPMLVVFALVIALFVAFEVVEWVWLRDVDPQLLRFLHRARGAAAALLAAGLASWVIAREGPPLLAAGPLPDENTATTSPEQKRLHYARWFILMRWIAIMVATVAVIGAVEVAELLPEQVGPALAMLIAWLTLLNLAYSVYLRQAGADTTFLATQVYMDIVVLILLLHFSGGIENPLTPVLLLHVIIAGIVLGRAHAYRVAVFSSVVFALLAYVECARLLPHYMLRLYPHFHVNGIIMHAAHDPLYAGSRVALQAVLLLLVAYFTTTLVERIREDERQLEAQAARAVVQAQSLEQALAEQHEAHARAMRAERLATVGELAGRVAHEVNNPIAIISAKARLMLRESAGLPAKAAREVTKIAELSDRVARIAQGLLSYCRPAAGARTPLDPAVPARRTLALIEPRAQSLHVRVIDELPARVASVHANAAELEQVFLNLFLNALDAMPDGGELRVSAESVYAGDTQRLALVVADTGCGIPAEIHDRIFEPFLTTKGGHGTGLGLSICQGLVRSHGGDIEVASAPGAGTRVTITLPVLPVETVRDTEVVHA
jgi:signal transduction histidine kinase